MAFYGTFKVRSNSDGFKLVGKSEKRCYYVCEGTTRIVYNTVSYDRMTKIVLVIVGLIINKTILEILLKQNKVQSEGIAQRNYCQTDLSTLHITLLTSGLMKRISSRLFSFFGAILKSRPPLRPRPSPPGGSDQVSSFHWRREGWFCCDIQAILSCHANQQGSISTHPPGGNLSS